MSAEQIQKSADKLRKLNSKLSMLKSQRAMLGTNRTRAGKVMLRVHFAELDSKDLAMAGDATGEKASSKDMLMLALVKSWDSMIDDTRRAIAAEAKALAELAQGAI